MIKVAVDGLCTVPDIYINTSVQEFIKHLSDKYKKVVMVNCYTDMSLCELKIPLLGCYCATITVEEIILADESIVDNVISISKIRAANEIKRRN